MRRAPHLSSFFLMPAFALLLGGCITVEQEIFLNEDGSGQLVMVITLPDLPEEMGGGGVKVSGPSKDPAAEIEKMKKDLAHKLPEGLRLLETKEVRQNGSISFYMIFAFEQLDDLGAVMEGFDNPEQREFDVKPEWKLALTKEGGREAFRISFYVDMEKMLQPKSKPEEAPEGPDMAGLDQLGQDMMQIFLGMLRFRFVLHAPRPIADTNADIVLRERTAVWNTSLAAFLKNPRPIEMTASY